MFVDRRCCAARHHSDRRRTAACELPAILIGRSPTTALDVPRGSSMFVDRRCCAARALLGPSLDGCVRAPRDPHRPQSDHGARCPTGAVDVRRSQVRHHSDRRSTAARPRSRRLVDVRGLGSSRFARGIRYVRRRRDVQDVCVRAHQRSSSAAVRPRRSMSHGGRRCSSIAGAASLGPSVDRSSASQHRRLGDVRGLGSSRFARGIGYVRRRRDVQDVCVRAPRDPHRSQSDRGPMSHGGRRCSSIAGAARRGITRTVARPQHGPQAAGRRCLRRWFEALGAGPRLVDRFVATRRTRSKAHHRESDMVAPHVGRSRERDRVQQCPDRGQCVTREDLR